MIKNSFFAAFVLLIVFAMYPVVSQAYDGSDETPAEELVNTTEEMSQEATEEFNEMVDCSEADMDGKEPSEDCVSHADDVEKYSDEMPEVIEEEMPVDNME